MSKSTLGDDNAVTDGDEGVASALTDEQRGLLAEIEDTFEPYLKSEQCRDHPDTDFPNGPARHHDGDNIYQQLGITPFHNFLAKATRHDHAVSTHPKALPHFLMHIRKWEKWELSEDEPDFSSLPDRRERVLEWFAGVDDETDDREGAMETRKKRLRNGGTGMVIHGEQGTTKTTALYWLVANIMQVNQMEKQERTAENVIWQSTLDDTEWQVFAPWATVCLPTGIDVSVTVDPYGGSYRNVDPFKIDMADICREVIRYDDVDQLVERLAGRTDGQFYVVYPDPRFRKCQALTGWPYNNVWEVDDSVDSTDINQFWFGLHSAAHESPVYNAWTTFVADEAHKWLPEDASDDMDKWWKKIVDWASYWGDARKNRTSVILAVHKWREIHYRATEKIRWGATMNGEEFPKEAPIDGKNTKDQGLGDMCVWSNLEWNHVGYPDIKRNFSVPADFEVTYPGWRDEIEAKS